MSNAFFFRGVVGWGIAAIAVTYVVSLLLLRRRLVGFFDPMHIAAGYMAFAFSFVGFTIWFGSRLGDHLSILLIITYLAILLPLNRREKFCGSEYAEMLEKFRESKSAQYFAIICTFFVLCNDFVNIASSAYNPFVDAGTQRYMVSANSHFLFYLGQPLAEALFLYVYAFRGTFAGRFAAFGFFLNPIFSFLSGDKSGMLSFAFNLIWFGYMARLDGQQVQTSRRLKTILILAFLLPISWVLISITLSHDSHGVGSLSIFIARLVGTFNDLIFATVGNLPIAHVHASFFQLYFVSILKALGVYTLPFGRASQYIEQTFGIYNVNKALANSQAPLEALICFGWPQSIFVVAAIGLITAFLINYFFRNRYKSPFHFLYFGLLLTEPFTSLLSGAFNFTHLYVVLVPYSVWRAAIALMGLPANVAHVREGAGSEYPSKTDILVDKI